MGGRRSVAPAGLPATQPVGFRLRDVVAKELNLNKLAPRLANFLVHRGAQEAEDAASKAEAPRDGLKLSHHVPPSMRTWWPVVEFAFTMALLLTVPFELCFLTDTPLEARALYWCADVFFTLGVSMLLHATAVALIQSGEKEQRDRNEPPGYSTYALLSLPLDIASSLPWDLVAEAAGTSAGTVRGLAALRMLRCLRLEQYATALHGALRSLNVRVPRMTWLVGKLMVLLVIFTHLIACCWWRLATLAEPEASGATLSNSSSFTPYGGWAADDDPLKADPDSVRLRYARSAYWAIVTLVTVGFGDIVPRPSRTAEIGFTMFVMYLGAWTSCTVVAVLCTVVTASGAPQAPSSSSGRLPFSARREAAHSYSRLRRLPHRISSRVASYYAYMWTQLRGFDEDEFLDEIPTSLRAELLLFLNQRGLRAVAFLKELEEETIAAIAQVLATSVFSAGDLVISSGSSVSALHLVARGRVLQLESVDAETAQVRVKYFEGNCFCEIALFVPGRARPGVLFVADTYSEVQRLHKRDFDRVVEAHLDEEVLSELRENVVVEAQMGLLDTGWKEDAQDEEEDAAEFSRWSTGTDINGHHRWSSARTTSNESHVSADGDGGGGGGGGGGSGDEAEARSEPSSRGRSRRGSRRGEEEMGFERERRPSQLRARAETAAINATDLTGALQRTCSASSHDGGAGSRSRTPEPNSRDPSFEQRNRTNSRLGAAACAVSNALSFSRDQSRRSSVQSRFAIAAAASSEREPGHGCWGSDRSASMASGESPRRGSAVVERVPTYKAQDDSDAEWTSPGSRFRVRLELTMAALLLYNLFTLPLRLAVLPGVANDATGAADLLGWLVADVIIDVVYAADMALHWLRFTANGADGELITDRRKLRKLWLGGGGRLDLLASLPIDYCVLAAKPADAQLALLPRALRLLRLSRVPRHLGVVRLLMARSNKQLSGALLRIIAMFSSTVLVVYSVTMAWLAVGIEADGSGWFREFLPNGEPDEGVTVNLSSEAYQRAFYFTLVTMTTVGYGDIVPHSYFETVVALMVVMMGGLAYPAVVSSIAPLMTSLNAAAEAHKAKVVHLRRWLSSWGAPILLTGEVIGRHEALYAERGGVDESGVLADLPPLLRQSVCAYMVGGLMSTNRVLEVLDAAALQQLTGLLRPQFYLVKEELLAPNEPPHAILLLRSGAADVVHSTQEQAIGCMHDGEAIGAAECVLQRLPQFWVFAHTNCDVLKLYHTDLSVTLAPQPDLAAKLQQRAEADLASQAARHTAIYNNLTDKHKISWHTWRGDLQQDYQPPPDTPFFKQPPLASIVAQPCWHLDSRVRLVCMLQAAWWRPLLSCMLWAACSGLHALGCMLWAARHAS